MVLITLMYPILIFKWILNRPLCTSTSWLTFVIQCFDIQTLLKSSSFSNISCYGSFIMKGFDFSAHATHLCYCSQFGTFLSAWLSFSISGQVDRPSGLPSAAALLKGTLTVIAEGGFRFHIQLSCPDSQLVWEFEIATIQYEVHLSKLCAGSRNNCSVCMCVQTCNIYASISCLLVWYLCVPIICIFRDKMFTIKLG